MQARPGVRGFWDWKFWAVLSLYFLSCLFLYQTGMNRQEFSIVFSVCVAYIIMSTIAWEYEMLGSPHRAHSLILQFAFGIALVFVFNAIVFSLGATIEECCAWFVGQFGLSAAADSLAGQPLAKAMEAIVKPVFSTVLSVFLFIAVPLLLSIRRSWSIPALLTLFFALSLLTIRLGLATAAWMLAGMAALAIAFRLQREDELQSGFWNRVRDRLAGVGERPRIETGLKLAMLERLFDKKAMNEAEIRGVISRRLGCDANDPRLVPAARAILAQLSVQDDLVEVRTGAHGQYAVLRGGPENDSPYRKLALIPKGVIVLAFTVLYILSPIDLIPDYIPVFGVMDDLAVGIFGAVSVFSTHLRLTRSKNPPPTGPGA